jgi:ribosome maturation factor RimP
MQLEALKKEIALQLERINYRLYDLEYVEEHKQMILRVSIDHSKGITIDDCVEVSQVLSDFLDQIDPFSESYQLEVSSPGAERPLRNLQEIEAAVGRYVHVETYEQVFEGDLVRFEPHSITVRDKRNKQTIIDVVDINMIRLAIKF